MQFYQGVIIYYILINIVAFALYGVDKFKAQSKLWRIPERTLIAIAFLGGAIGALIGMKIFHHKTRKKKFTVSVPVALILHIILICVTTYNDNHLVITEYDIDGSADLRIVHLSDLHNYNLWFDEDYIVDRVEELNPDVIVITGDIVNGNSSNIDYAINIGTKLSQIAETYYVTGNHEVRLGNRLDDLLDGLSNAGVIILDGDNVVIGEPGNSFMLYGYNYNEFPSDTSVIPESNGLTSVLLYHTPDIDSGFDLILSGHMHGGQINIPGLGPVFSPDFTFFPDEENTMGLSTNGDSTRIISRGIGSSGVPVRFNNFPEIVVINMHNS